MGGSGTWSHMCDDITRHAVRAEGHFVKLTVSSYRFWKEGLLVRFRALPVTCYERERAEL